MVENRYRDVNHRWVIFFCLVIVGASAATNDDYEEVNKEYKVIFGEPRSDAELMEEKYSQNDSIVEAIISEYGYRFMIIPSNTTYEALTENNRFTLRVDFDIVGFSYGNRAFVEIIEIDNSEHGIPYNKFRYNNIMFMNVTRVVDIPIPEDFLKKWMAHPFKQIGFIIKIEFGMLSNVKKVYCKRPVLIFSRVPRPRCNEFTCCLNSNVHMIKGPIYYNLVVPNGFQNQRCIDCLRVSEIHPPKMDNFNMIIHEQMDEEDAAQPSQIGKCRATEWTGMPVIFTASRRGRDFDILQKEVPYFTPQACECVEDDDIPLDYEDIENHNDHNKRKQFLENPRNKATTHTP